MGRLASVFPKCPNDLKTPEKLGEVTGETEAAPSEVRLMKRLRAVPAQGAVGRVGSQYQRLLCLSQSRCLSMSIEEHEWVPNAGIRAWSAEGSHHEEMTDNMLSCTYWSWSEKEPRMMFYINTQKGLGEC